MMRSMRLVLLACAWFAATATHATAQRHGAAVSPDTVTVGGRFRVAVRIEVPPGMRISFPDTLDVPADVEAAARREMQSDTATGVETLTAIYTLAAWKPGTIELPPAKLRLMTEDANETLEIALPPVTVMSVLPADTAGIEPMPLKDVLGPDRALLPLLLALCLALLLLALAIWAWRRRRLDASSIEATPAVPPRQRALEALDHLLASGLLERGDLRAFYFAVTAILREYVAAVNPEWGTDLTTAELRARMSGRFRFSGQAADVAAPAIASRGVRLDALLVHADLIKFARHGAAPGEARGDLETARRWVEEFDWPMRLEEWAA